MIHALTILAVLVVTAVLFCGWLIVVVARFIWRLITGLGRQDTPRGAGRPCMNPGCRTDNPLHARFCRRCGINLREPVFFRQLPQPGPRFNPANGRERQLANI